MLPSRPEIRRKRIVFFAGLPFAAVLCSAVYSMAESQVAVQPRQNRVLSEQTYTAEPRNFISSSQTGSVRMSPEMPPPEQEPVSEPPPTSSDENQTVVDVVHATVSRGIQESATWMDSFFGDRRYESELNESYVRMRSEVFKEKGSDFSFSKPDFRIRIILPELRRKTHIIFSGKPKERSDFSAIGFVSEDPADREEDDDVTAGIQQTLLDTVKDNLSIRVGVRLHERKPYLVFGPRYRILFPLDSWQLRFIEEVIWTNQDGWESTTTFDAERQLARNFFFRASNTWSWVEHTAGFLYDISFGIRQPIDNKRALGYEWVNLFMTRPVHELYETALRVRYRQQLWREWAFFEIAPQYRFPRSDSFRGLAGILFRMEIIFGDYR